MDLERPTSLSLSCCRQVSYTANSIALHFNIRAKHLPNERFETTEFDDEKFVVGCVHYDKLEKRSSEGKKT